MADEVKIRVRLDTRQARGELDGFVREGAKTAGRVAGRLRRSVGRGLGLVGAGAAVGTGLAAVRGASASGLGDVIGEHFGALGAQIAETIFGSLDEEARATKSAREETIQAFGAIAGARGAIPPGAANWFAQVRALRVEEERGRELFERDTRFRPESDIGDLVTRIMSGIGELLSQAVGALGDRLLRAVGVK